MGRAKGTKNNSAEIISKIMKEYTEGKSARELAAKYSKPFKTIKNMITRENNKKRKAEVAPSLSQQHGRKPAVTLQEYKYENKRLQMENELLRDFLSLAGRR